LLVEITDSKAFCQGGENTRWLNLLHCQGLKKIVKENENVEIFADTI